jgi:ATP-dependent Clp protease adaptor protein ClpS
MAWQAVKFESRGIEAWPQPATPVFFFCPSGLDVVSPESVKRKRFGATGSDLRAFIRAFEFLASGLTCRAVRIRFRLMETETLPEIIEDTKEKVENAFAKNWNVIVWNDPINLMSYVVFVFMKVLAFPKEKATKHMLEVHHEGKSCVATETREKAELYHQQLQGFGLSVTIERTES